MGKKIQLIVILIVLNVLNFRLKRGIMRSKIYRIYIKHGIFLSLKGISIDRKLNISIDRIYFKQRSRIGIISKSFFVNVSFRTIVFLKRKSAPVKKVSCEWLDVLFKFPDKANGERTVDVTTTGQSSFLQRLCRRMQGRGFNRLVHLVYTINITHIRIRYSKGNKRAEGEVVNFEKKGGAIRCNNIFLKQKGVVIAETASFDLSLTQGNSSQYFVSSKVMNLYINFSLLSTEPLRVNQVDVNAGINVLKGRVEVSRNSVVLFNGIPLLVEFSYDTLKDDFLKTSFIIIIRGNSFFKNYPLFYTRQLNNIEGSGELVLQIIYVHSLHDIAASYFRTKVIKDDLHISNLNDPVLCALNSDFLYTAVKNKQVLREIQIGEGNPSFLSIQQIPKTLTALVITCEDPNFYDHEGIDAYAIQLAILHNFKQRKFSRGASTITMQLVRNLLLGHHKNISRKLEEFMIAWLLEKHVPVNKERILEIYLNIIEFGYNVYGVSEASLYYFGKPVAGLSFLEQLVLCYIIPRPDFFLDALLSQSQQLKKNLKNYIRCYSQMLLAREGITENEIKDLPNIIFFKPEFGSLCLD